MRKHFFIGFVLVFTLGVYISALQAGEIEGKKHLIEPSGMELSVEHGDARITVDSFGTASTFESRGIPNHLFEALHFVSVNNGRVDLVSGQNYRVDQPVEIIERREDRTSSKSTVERNQGGLVIDIFNSIADRGDGLMDWYIEFYMSNFSGVPMPVCYYFYIDLDLFGDPDNTVATARQDPDAGHSFRLMYRPMPDSLFEVVTELTGRTIPLTLRPDRFEMKPWRDVLDRLENASSCIELPNEQSQLNEEFTGALRYRTTIAAGEFAHVDLRVSRLQ